MGDGWPATLQPRVGKLDIYIVNAKVGIEADLARDRKFALRLHH